MTPAEELRAASACTRETAKGILVHGAEVLAAWLESAANHAGKVSDPRSQEAIADRHALAYARAVNARSGTEAVSR